MKIWKKMGNNNQGIKCICNWTDYNYSSWKLLTEQKYCIQGREQAATIFCFSHYKEAQTKYRRAGSKQSCVQQNHSWTPLPQDFEVKTVIAFKNRLHKNAKSSSTVIVNMKSIRNHFVIGISILSSPFWHTQTDELNPLLLSFLRLLALEIRIPRTETMSDAVPCLKVSLKKSKETSKQKNNIHRSCWPLY